MIRVAMTRHCHFLIRPTFIGSVVNLVRATVRS